MRRLKTVPIEVTAANYPEVQTALQAKKDGNPKPTYKLIREGLRSRDQRAAAKNPRQDALQALIVEIMTPNPTMTPGELLAELRRLVEVSPDVVYEVSDKVICFYANKYDPKGVNSTKEVPISGLKDRMYRARKTIASR